MRVWSAPVLEPTVIKDIHQIMTLVPEALHRGTKNRVTITTAIKHTDDVSQQDSSCFLVPCDSLTNYVWCVLRRKTSKVVNCLFKFIVGGYHLCADAYFSFSLRILL